MDVKIIEQPFEWNRVVTQAHFYDLYHLYTYSKLQETGRPILFYVGDNNNFIAIPLLIRNIDNTDYFDCTSVYGYPGPISNLPYNRIPTDLINNFQIQLLKFFRNSSIVSAFSRLNPLVDQSVCFPDMGKVVEQGRTISIDLTLSMDDQWRGYRKSYKGDINRLYKMGYVVKKAVSEVEIEEFTSVYHETMLRVGANEKYFFTADYFKKLIHATDVQCTLLVSYIEGKIACGALFASTHNVMQYHIAATKTEFLGNAPMKLVVDEARRIANAESLKYFHMGGGATGQLDDPLFHFKKGFSDLILPFKVWKFVVDERVYDDLVNEHYGDVDGSESYFPLYRKKHQALVI